MKFSNYHKSGCCVNNVSPNPYVIVINRNAKISHIRHIVSISLPYNENEFKQWYYDTYHKLDGDEFVFCASRDERDRYIETLNKE